MRRLFSLAAAGAAILFSHQVQAQKAADTVRVAINDTFAVLDSYHAPFDEASSFDRVVYQSLIGYDQVAGKQLNVLAKSLTRLNSNTLEVELRENVVFHNGNKFDADDVKATVALIKSFGADLLINVALPYQDLNLMDACLHAGIHYVDTANYEPPHLAKFEYSWQWAYRERFQKAGLTALLGSGFDPGVTNVFCAYAQKHLFDSIETVDIMDANAGDHGYPFATNFNPEINIREITQRGRYWEQGEWKETDPLSVKWVYDYPGIGPKDSYLLFHEELESLAINIKGLKRIRFFMTFSQNYLTHLRVLENVGMTRIDPVDFQGHKIVPIQFLKALLPDPASLGPRTKGKTCIGNCPSPSWTRTRPAACSWLPCAKPLKSAACCWLKALVVCPVCWPRFDKKSAMACT